MCILFDVRPTVIFFKSTFVRCDCRCAPDCSLREQTPQVEVSTGAYLQTQACELVVHGYNHPGKVAELRWLAIRG